MSVATEDWLERRGRQPYTQEQLRMLAEAILAGETSFSKEKGRRTSCAKWDWKNTATEMDSRAERRNPKDSERSTDLAQTGRGMAGENN